MNLAELVLSQGHKLERKTGEEWAGPCPSCGGNDRFVVFESGGREGIAIPGRFFCRGCHPLAGDCVEYLHAIEGLSIAEALKEAGVSKTVEARRALPSRRPERAEAAAVAVQVPDEWSAQAERVLSSARQRMRTPAAREFYEGKRGLSLATCEALGFGWLALDSYTASELWGLPEGGKVVVPAGAVMPIRRKGSVVSLQVRRLKPYTPKGAKKPLWHHHTKGGAQVPFLCGPSGAPLVVVESILCAASIFQASGGTVAAVALCGSTKGNGVKLDEDVVEAVRAAAVVLVAGDRDEAGEKVLAGILEVRPDAFPYTVPGEWNGNPISDPNDLLQAGGDKAVRGWIAYGIRQAMERAKGFSSAEQGEAPDHDNTDKVFSIETQDEAGEALNIVDPGEPEPFAGDDETDPQKGDVRAMPERSETIDQEHGGTASDTMETPRDDGPDEFAAHVAYCRETFKDGPPMIAKDMPDWERFCIGWWHDCLRCPYHDGNPNGSPCTLWEAAFPCAVRWYPPTC